MDKDESGNSLQSDLAGREECAGDVVSVAQQNDPEFAEILEKLPAEKRAELVEIVAASESHSGWLPSPKYLREYEAILPGLAERIVSMPEREQTHRHKVIEKMVVDERTLKGRGQIMALVSLILLVGFAIFLAVEGQFEWAAKVAMFNIVGVVGIFVTGKWADIQTAKAKDEGQDLE